jgi:hypothetical protein
MPFRTGSATHCIGCQVSGFSLTTDQINLKELVGGRVLASVERDGDYFRLIRVEPFSAPARYKAPATPTASSVSPRLGHGEVPNVVRLGGGFVEDSPRRLESGARDS